MSYLVLSCNREGYFSKFSSSDPDPDTDHLSGGLSHGCITSCLKIESQSKR